MKSGIFNILAGQKIGMYFQFNPRELCLDVRHPRTGLVIAKLPYKRIVSVQLKSNQYHGTGDAIAGAILGGAIAGSIGAALGASAGGDQQTCMVAIESTDGTVYTCEATRNTFDELLRYRYVDADQSKFEPPVSVDGFSSLIEITYQPKVKKELSEFQKTLSTVIFVGLALAVMSCMVWPIYSRHVREEAEKQAVIANTASFNAEAEVRASGAQSNAPASKSSSGDANSHGRQSKLLGKGVGKPYR